MLVSEKKKLVSVRLGQIRLVRFDFFYGENPRALNTGTYRYG